MRRYGVWTGLTPPEMVSAADIGTVLLHATARSVCGRDCAGLDSGPTTRAWARAGAARRLARGGARLALAAERVGEVDADAVAQWITDRYPGSGYPAVVIGSAHGAVAHLAAALRVPWLPAGFRVSVAWPGSRPDDVGAGMAYGRPLAARLLETDPSITVHQVWHSGQAPPSASTVDFAVTWQALPIAYHRFLVDRLDPGGSVVLIADRATHPAVLADDGRYRFQLGGGQVAVPGGLVGQLRAWTTRTGTAMRVVLSGEDALSAGVADVYRHWLRACGKTGNRLVVECGRLIDPWQVLRAGLVPYWCPRAEMATVTALELWLAGSEAFTCVEILPEAPGGYPPGLADPDQWRAVAAFGTRRGVVDRACLRGYPCRVRAVSHATQVLRRHPYDPPIAPPLAAGDALRLLDDSAAHLGLLVM